MNKISKRGGFTLIELLVVIAIIGILSSIILVSLNTARNKGNDAKIQATVSGVRAAAEVFANGGSYENLFSDNSTGKPYIDSLNGMSVTNFKVASSSGYALSAQLKSNSALGFCVDSNGNATTTAWSSVDELSKLSDSNGCL